MSTRSTGSCVVVRERKVLLLLDGKAHRYVLPGGPLDNGRSPQAIAARAAESVLGCPVAVTRQLGVLEFSEEGLSVASHLFEGVLRGEVSLAGPYEDGLWMPVGDFEKYPLSPDVRSFCRLYLQGMYATGF